jgi:hypothetical protein
MRTETILDADHCAYCGHEVTAATSLSHEGATPKPGDPTLCIECGEWLWFDDHLRLRKPTDDELMMLGTHPQAQAARRAWLKAKQTWDRDEARNRGFNS